MIFEVPIPTLSVLLSSRGPASGQRWGWERHAGEFRLQTDGKCSEKMPLFGDSSKIPRLPSMLVARWMHTSEHYTQYGL